MAELQEFKSTCKFTYAIHYFKGSPELQLKDKIHHSIKIDASHDCSSQEDSRKNHKPTWVQITTNTHPTVNSERSIIIIKCICQKMSNSEVVRLH